jgi:tetratricopeptide (TPR) repeat protein
LTKFVEETTDKSEISPLVYYYLGYFTEQQGNLSKAKEFREQAALQPLDYVFPFQQEVIDILRSAIQANPKDARAPYYLGNLLYDWQPEEATKLWERSSELDPKIAITWRNLAIAYSHQDGEDSNKKAINCLEKAINLPNPYPTHFAELDQLYKSEGVSVEKRLEVLEKNEEVVMKKDEAIGALVNLKIFAGKVDEAISILKSRVFSIWEGGSAFDTGDSWANAHLIRGINNFEKKKYQQALNDFQTALDPPENLRADRSIAQAIQIKYWIGKAYEAMDEPAKAEQVWEEVIDIELETNWSRRFDNTQEQNYFKTLAQKKIFPSANVEDVFTELVNKQDKKDTSEKDELAYQFVRSKENTLDQQAYPHYLSGLGYLGLGNKSKAREEFNAALKISPDYLPAKIQLNQL